MATWLNEKFVENVLQSYENDDTICVIDISAKPATNEGDNYTSDMIRVKVLYNRCQNDNIVTEERSIIIKTEVTDDIYKKQLAQYGLFNVEIIMMTKILKEMNSLLGNARLSCNCLFTQQQDPALLVLDDLAMLGFRMVDRLGRLDLQHSTLALRNLAKFHAASVAVCEKTPDYKKMLSKGVFHCDAPGELIDHFFISSMRGLSRAIASWEEFGENYSNRLMKLSEVIRKKLVDCHEPHDNEFNVINHNDYWTNNMLFKYDSKGRVIDHIMVDFQACYYGSPAIDLTHFFSLCICETVSEKQRNELFEEYLDVLTSTMHDLECKTHPPNMEEMKEAMHKREIHGLMMSCAVLPFNIIDRKKLASHNKAYENEKFKVEISKKLRQWHDMGLLDI